LNETKIEFVKLDASAQIPIRGTEGSAGYDLYTVGKPELKIDEMGSPLFHFRTGLAIHLPQGHFFALYPRSSLMMKGYTLANCVGVIDEDYRGEIMFRLRPSDNNAKLPTETGLRLIQGIVCQYRTPEWVEVDNLTDSDRGSGGYGSTGK